MERPHCCPERSCTPIKQTGVDPGQSAGESWTCSGKMASPTTFAYDGVEHVNDLNTCIYTPLKGCVRFQECAMDWALNIRHYQLALIALFGVESMPLSDPFKWMKAVESMTYDDV